MITLDQLQKIKDYYLVLKRESKEIMKTGNISDDFEDWTMIVYNISIFGYDENDFLMYVRGGTTPAHWVS